MNFLLLALAYAAGALSVVVYGVARVTALFDNLRMGIDSFTGLFGL